MLVLWNANSEFYLPMGKDTLSVKVEGDLHDRFTDYHDDQSSDKKSNSLRQLLDAGLRVNGYVPKQESRESQWLRLARGIGSVLGITALILLAAGTYLPNFSGPGLGLATASIGFYAGAEIADRHGETIYDWLVTKLKDEASHWGLPADDGSDDA